MGSGVTVTKKGPPKTLKARPLRFGGSLIMVEVTIPIRYRIRKKA